MVFILFSHVQIKMAEKDWIANINSSKMLKRQTPRQSWGDQIFLRRGSETKHESIPNDSLLLLLYDESTDCFKNKIQHLTQIMGENAVCKPTGLQKSYNRHTVTYGWRTDVVDLIGHDGLNCHLSTWSWLHPHAGIHMGVGFSLAKTQ